MHHWRADFYWSSMKGKLCCKSGLWKASWSLIVMQLSAYRAPILFSWLVNLEWYAHLDKQSIVSFCPFNIIYILWIIGEWNLLNHAIDSHYCMHKCFRHVNRHIYLFDFRRFPDSQRLRGWAVVNQEQSWFQKTSIAQKLDIKRQSQARLVYIIQCIYPSHKQEPSLADLFPPDIVFLIVDVNLGRKKHM